MEAPQGMESGGGGAVTATGGTWQQQLSLDALLAPLPNRG